MNDFDYNEFIKIFNFFLYDKEWESLIELSDTVPEKYKNSYIKSATAYAMTNSENNFNFPIVHEMLMSSVEDKNFPINWNYRMGLAQERACRFASAIYYYNEELKFDKTKEEEDELKLSISELSKCIDLGSTGLSFNHRAKDFWADFSDSKENLDALLKTENQDDADLFIYSVLFMLKTNSIEASLRLGSSKISGKYHIIFEFNSDLSQYIMLKQLVLLMPDNISKDYIFSLGAISHFDFTFRLNDTLLNISNLQMAFFQNRKKVDIYFKNASLESIYAEDPIHAKEIANILANNFLGEVFCLKNVSDVCIYTDEDLDFHRIDLLVQDLRRLYDDVTYINFPYDDYRYYRFESSYPTELVRNSAKNTFTCFDNILFEFMNNESTCFDKNFDQGISYLYLAADISRFNEDKALSIRNNLEECLRKNSQNAYNIIGLAISKKYIFIDLVVFDADLFRDKLIWENFEMPAKKLGIKMSHISPLRYEADSFMIFDLNEDERNKLVHAGDFEFSALSKEAIPIKNKYSYAKEDKNKIFEFIDKNIGKPSEVYYENYEDDLSLEIHVIKPTSKENYYSLVTVNMGTYEMNIPYEESDKDIKRAELIICLPSDWDEQMNDGSNYAWAIKWLRIIAHMPLDENTWLMASQAIESEESISSTNDFYGFLLCGPAFILEDTYFPLSSGDDINFYQIIPLYMEEIEYRNLLGTKSLFEKMKKELEFVEAFIITENRENSVSADDLYFDDEDENFE